MLPRAVPALATRTGPPMVPCERRVSLTAQGLLPRHGVHGGPGGVSHPPRLFLLCAGNDIFDAAFLLLG